MLKSRTETSGLVYVDCAIIKWLVKDTYPGAVPELVELYTRDAKERFGPVEKASRESNMETFEFDTHALLTRHFASHGAEMVFSQADRFK